MSDLNDETVLSPRKRASQEPSIDETVLSTRVPAAPQAPAVDETVLSTRSAPAPAIDETVLSTRSAPAPAVDETVLSTRSASVPAVDETVLSTRSASVSQPPAEETILSTRGAALPAPPEAAPEPAPFVGTREVVDASEAASQDHSFGRRELPVTVSRENKFEPATVTKVGKSADDLWKMNQRRVQRRSTKLIVGLIISGVAIAALVIVGIAIFSAQS